MKKTICLITPRLPPTPGGIGVQAFQLGKALQEKNYAFNFITYERNVALKEIQSMPDCSLLRVNMSMSTFRLFFAMYPYIARSYLIHCFGYTPLTTAATLCGKVLKKPVLFTYVGGEIWDYSPAFPDIFACMTRRATEIVCDSQCLSKKLYSDIQVKSHVIRPVVRDIFIHSNENEIPENKHDALKQAYPILLCVKGLVKRSGHDSLIRAMVDIKKNYPGVMLILCGNGSEQRYLESLSSDLGVRDHIVFAGIVPDTDLVYYYRICNIFVLPSLVEAFPSVILEALACGKPVVSADSEGPKEAQEIFPDDIILAPKGNYKMLASEIIKTLSSGKTVSEKTKEKVKKDFNCAAFCDQYLSIYNSLLIARF